MASPKDLYILTSVVSFLSYFTYQSVLSHLYQWLLERNYEMTLTLKKFFQTANWWIVESVLKGDSLF